MSTVREYFETESAVYLQRLSDAVAAANGGLDVAELQRLARALRGTAHIARETHVMRAALGLESAVRSLGSETVPADATTRERLLDAIADLRALAAGEADDAERETRVAAVLMACNTLVAHASPAGSAPAGSVAEANVLRRQFRDYVAREIADIAIVLDESVTAFRRDPLDREALTAVLRRQRALLGAVRLDEVRVVAETLRAVEDIAGIIARLSAPVKVQWLDVFRCARDVLRAAVEPLQSGEEPRSTNALSRLRTLHQELLERYGAVEPAAASRVPAAVSSARPVAIGLAVTTPPAVQAPEPALDARAALRRAIELRPAIEQAVGNDPRARSLVDELFDLIRIAQA